MASRTVEGVRGEPTVLAPAGVFARWKGKEPAAPKSYVGIGKSAGAPIIVFHDPETSYVVVRDKTILLIQAVSGGDKLGAQLDKVPTDKWKRLTGTYTSDGGEHVLFNAMYSAADYDDEDMVDDAGGRPMRITIPEGTYALEEYGEWTPAKKTEYILCRLVPER